MIAAILVDYYGVLADQVLGGWQINYELVHMLQNLKRQYKIGLLSNSYARSLEELDSKLDAGLFDLVLIGGSTELWKPETIVYETAAQRLGLEPAQILAIDDNLTHLESASNVGLATLHYVGFDKLNEQLKAKLGHIKS